MKLRQKLAVVLASAMVITAVPVTTMAASTNKFNKTMSLVKGTEVTTKSGLELQMEFDQDPTGEVFFIDATDFEFNANEYKLKAQGPMGALETAIVNAQNTVNTKQAELDALKAATTPNTAAIAAKEAELKTAKTALTTAKKALDNATADDLEIGNLEISVLSETQLKVKVRTVTTNDIAVPVFGKAKAGTPAITVDGSDSLATSGKYALTGGEIVTDKVLVATAGDAKNISVDGAGVIADITIEEQVTGSLDEKQITITLPNSSDLIFNSTYATEKTLSSDDFEGKRGLAGNIDSVKVKYFEDEDGKKDNKKLVVTVDTKTVAKPSRGSVVLKNIAVEAEDRKGDVDTGEVKVTVASKDAMADTKLVVANVAEYGVALTVDEVDELTAGQGTTKVKVKIKENAIDSLNKKQNVYFTIEEGYFVGLTEKDGFSINDDKDEITLDLSHNKGTTADPDYIFTEDKVNEFEFEVEIAAKATHEGPVVIKAESRAFDEDLTVEVAKVTPAVEIKADPITVKAGLKDQVGGKIVITESKEEKLAKNKQIIIKADDAWGFAIEDAKVEVTDGDIEIEDKVNKDGEIIITVKRTSDEASEITISDIKVTTNRTIPEGTFDFLVGGNAISQDKNVNDDVTSTRDDERFEDALTIEDFIVVGTKNTEDLPNAAAAKEIVLTVNSTSYTVNGEAKTADAAAFIDANNRTMVPVRFVAEEFGKIDFGTVNGVGTVTVFKDGSVLQFQNGSNIMNKNGIAIPMDTTVVIKDGRTYVPFKYVADGLGINFSFDAATKSITFTNQAQ